MKTLSEVRFGFVGAGQIAHNAAGTIGRHENASVVAIHDTHEQRLNDLCDKLGTRPHLKIEDLYADDGVDAVYIATPNKFHAPLAKQALEAGKHVILEKPFAMNFGEAEQVIAAAKSSDCVFSLGMNQRFNPDSQKIKALVMRGGLGEVYHAKAYWRRRSGIPKLGTWFGNRELAGGGCLYDIGVHMLDLCLYLIDAFDPVSVSGVTYTKFGNRGLGEGGWGMSERSDIQFDVDDFASALIKFSSGKTVTLDATWACHQQSGNMDNVEIFGTDAGATARPAKIFKAGAGDNENYQIIDEVGGELLMPHADRFHNFINHLLGKEELCVTYDQALAVQKILDGIAESNLTGREVRFD
ncbi:MAG: Gfo/Idh/MocA family oxidoreductase [Verrucomicrobiota bacterium]